MFLRGKAEIAVKTRQVFQRTARGCKSFPTVLAFRASKEAI